MMNMPSQDDDRCYYKVATLFKFTTVHMFSAIIFPRNGRHNVGCMVQGRVAGTVFLALYWPRNVTLSSKTFNGN